MRTDVIPEGMLGAIAAAYDRWEAALNRFMQPIEADRPPEVIYHYTTSPGLLGLLSSGKIWLTDVFGLNDPSEVLHGVARAGKILAIHAQHAHPAAKLFAERLNEIISRYLQNVAHFFVASFSHDGDELGQWRAYADNGNGFALGFDANALERVYSVHRQGVLNATYPITYNDALLDGICEGFASDVMPLIALPQGRSPTNDVINEYVKQLSIALAKSVMRAAMYFKHEAYKAEREYRFLQVRPFDDSLNDLQCRAKRLALVRFTEFDWKERHRETLREVIIGPAASKQDARAFVESCLALARIDPRGVSIHDSQISYRS